jgi:hypothetical protein
MPLMLARCSSGLQRRLTTFLSLFPDVTRDDDYAAGREQCADRAVAARAESSGGTTYGIIVLPARFFRADTLLSFALVQAHRAEIRR